VPRFVGPWLVVVVMAEIDENQLPHQRPALWGLPQSLNLERKLEERSTTGGLSAAEPQPRAVTSCKGLSSNRGSPLPARRLSPSVGGDPRAGILAHEATDSVRLSRCARLSHGWRAASARIALGNNSRKLRKFPFLVLADDTDDQSAVVRFRFTRKVRALPCSNLLSIRADQCHLAQSFSFTQCACLPSVG